MVWGGKICMEIKILKRGNLFSQKAKFWWGKISLFGGALGWLGIPPSLVFYIGVRRDSGRALLLKSMRGRRRLAVGGGTASRLPSFIEFSF